MKLCLLPLLILGSLAMASAQDNATERTVSVQGSAQVSIEPDEGNVEFTVSVTQPSARMAQEVAANATTAVLEALAEVQGLNVTRDVRTITITVAPKTVRCNSVGCNFTVRWLFVRQACKFRV